MVVQKLRFPFASASGIWLMAALAALGMSAQAVCQSGSNDEVNITPLRTRTVATATTAEGDVTSSSFRTKPMRVDVNLVLVPVTVSDASNEPVTNLTKDDFVLYEDDKPQRVEYFNGEDAPISVGLILDYSDSMKNKIDYEREAVNEFFKNANPGDDYFAVTISNKPKLVASSTQSIGTLQDRLTTAKPEGGTALFDAIYMGMVKLRSAAYQRKALLIVSDGGDNHSRYTLREIKSMVSEGDTLTYAIGLFDDLPFDLFKTFEERWGRKWMSEITDVSGGRTIAADNRQAIPQIAAQISRELRNQYVLGYRPSNAQQDGKWRKIVVRVKARAQQHFAVHFKQGYFAPAEATLAATR